ncbi:lipopolysaccharide biosynthesis protein [Caryophanon latum]|uniref:lipopolysaccharide biosynthesis protein n=1 Tax=Caryophanon latum TaxID=33977 RepID=UPI000A0056E5|nr:oligosaccharide flippase family protein [Caryophanon latum]
MGAVLSYINILVATLIGLIYTPFLLKILGQNEYGLYSLILALMSFLAILDLGFGNSIVRFNSKFRALKDENGVAQLNGLFVILYSSMAMISLIIGYFLYTNFELLIGSSLTVNEVNKAKVMFGILILNLAFTLFMSIYNSLLIAYEKFVVMQSLNLFKTLTLPLIMTPLLLIGYKSISLVLITAILNIIALIIASIYCYKQIKIQISFKNIQFNLFKDISVYSFFILINILVDKLYAPTSQYILGITVGTAAVAIYAIGIQFTSYFTTLSTSLNSVFLPRITHLVVEDNKKEISNIFVKIGRLQFIILAFVLSGFFLFGKEFIVLWAGEDYVNSYYIALIIMFPALIPLSQNIGIVILQAKNRMQFRVLLYLVLAVINVFLSYFLSIELNEIGPALSMFIANLFGQILIMNYYYYKYIEINIPRYWKEIFGISIIIIAITSVVFIIKYYVLEHALNNWLTLGLAIITYVIILCSCLFKFVFNEYEKELLTSLIRRFRRSKK